MTKMDQLIVDLQSLSGTRACYVQRCSTCHTKRFISRIGIMGPHGNEMEGDEGRILVGAFSITLLTVEEFLKELGPFAISKYEILAAQEQFDMVRYQRDIGLMQCKIVNEIYHSMPVRDNVKNPIYADAPACLPQEFVKLRNQKFTILLNTQRTRLSFPKSPHEIALLEDEFLLLRNCYRVTEVALKTAIDALPADATFSSFLVASTIRWKI